MSAVILAQIPDPLLSGLAQAGVLGVIVAVFFVRDWIRDKRDSERELRRDQRETARDERLDKIAEAMNNLTRALTMEVMSRPQMIKRAEDEARELHASVTRNSGG